VFCEVTPHDAGLHRTLATKISGDQPPEQLQVALAHQKSTLLRKGFVSDCSRVSHSPSPPQALLVSENLFHNIKVYFENSCRNMILDDHGTLLTPNGSELHNDLCNDFDSYCFTATMLKEKGLHVEAGHSRNSPAVTHNAESSTTITDLGASSTQAGDCRPSHRTCSDRGLRTGTSNHLVPSIKNQTDWKASGPMLSNMGAKPYSTQHATVDISALVAPHLGGSAGNPGPQLQLPTQMKVPDTAQSIQFAMEGNIDGLKSLFSQGLASPRDVSNSRGFSLMRVGLTTPSPPNLIFYILLGKG
jgi:hypothetical protein